MRCPYRSAATAYVKRLCHEYAEEPPNDMRQLVQHALPLAREIEPELKLWELSRCLVQDLRSGVGYD